MTWVSYAQNYEDVTLLRALRDVQPGFYIDVGANDPRADSVTRAFYELGWCGINLEPVAHWHERLVADRPRDHNLRLAAGPTEGLVQLYEVIGTGLSTADPVLAERHAQDGHVVQAVEVPVRRLDDICHDLGVTQVHFLKIDVEGAEPGVLAGLSLTQVRPWVVVVEATLPGSQASVHPSWESLLTERGYAFVWFDGLNRFYVASEHAALSPALAQPPSVFDDFMRYTERLLRDDVADYRVLLQQARAESDLAQTEWAEVQTALAAAQAGSAEAHARLAELLRSRSWQMTAPVRWLGTQARRMRALVTAAGASLPAPTPTPEPTPEPTSVPTSVPTSAPAPPPASPLPRLAVVSPLPPLRSGVADYCAALLPGLAAHYTIEVITDQAETTDTWVAAHCLLRSLAWFDANAQHYDRIVYHFGNSLFHAPMFGLLARHRGTVVLHDVVLSDLLEHLERTGAQPFAFQQALYRSHGWPALRDRAQRGRGVAVRTWPASRGVFEAADGVILTTDYAERWVGSLYGAGLPVSVVRLPRPLASTDGRVAARRRLGLADHEFVVCSFGFIDVSKQSKRLLAAWQACGLGADASCRLVFVGENSPGRYGQALAAAIAAVPGPASVKVTGFADTAVYCDWLAAADLAVQLRASTRGEASGAVLDCLAHGLPVLVNAHGALADLPLSCVHQLNDAFTDAELAAALQVLRHDAARRAQLSQAARAFVAEHHDPVSVAARHAQSIERFHLGAAEPKGGPRQLLLDVTALALHDLGSGIQRVVRSVLNCALLGVHPGWRVEPVMLNQGRYEYARRFTARALGLDAWGPQPGMSGLVGLPPDSPLADAPVQVHAGDVFLGLDLVTHAVHLHESVFEGWRAQGVAIHFVVYDLLPLQLPACFPTEDADHFRSWLGTVCRVADGLICISQATADALRPQLATLAPGRPSPPAVSWFHLGADLPASLPTQGMSGAEAGLLARLGAHPICLMVGTVEPRKGHAVALDAFEQLWAQGVDFELIIGGRAGWMVDALVARLRAHPQAGRQLIWLETVSDQLLSGLYRQASLLLMASEGEGFGLPLIEAAQHGLPILTRDLPVFREVAGEHAAYWQGDAGALAQALRQWLSAHQAGQAPASAGLPWLTWQQAAEQLLRAVLGPEAQAIIKP